MSDAQEIKSRFLSLYEEVKTEFFKDIEAFKLPNMANEWINGMCDYNVPSGIRWPLQW